MPSAGKSYDTLIVGQGLAGSLLAVKLIAQGLNVLVLDDGHKSASSVAAAGLITPVTGQRVARTRHLEDYLVGAHKLYRDLEQHSYHPLLHQRDLLRVFRSAKERERWIERAKDIAYQPYLEPALAPKQSGYDILDPYGSGYLHQAGYLDTGALLTTVRRHLEQSASYRRDTVNYRDFRLGRDSVTWCSRKARQVIFCEGYRVTENPWFNWLALQPVKGEILTLRPATRFPEVIISAGIWLLPVADGSYKLGATYDRDQVDEQPTEQARLTLTDALQHLLPQPLKYAVLAHRAGVRPATRDKEPYVGLHPQYPQLGIFNGFGSKGSLAIPWHAEIFAHFLLGKQALPQWADIRRLTDRDQPKVLVTTG